MVKLQPARWSKKHTAVLEKAINDKVFNPHQTENAYINELYANLEEGSILKTVPAERFRQHYREKCAHYLTELALRGQRRHAAAAKKEESEEEDPTSESEEEVTAPPPPPEETTKPPAKKMTTTTTTTTTATSTTKREVKHLPDEKLWVPIHFMRRYRAKKHDRYQVTVELNGAFTGDSGTWKTGVCDDGLTFFLRIPIDETYVDPYYVFGMLEQEGRIFSDDSDLFNAWKKSKREWKGKYQCLRVPLDFKCKAEPSDDFAHDGVVLSSIQKKNHRGDLIEVPVLLVELASVRVVDADDDEQKYDLKKTVFTSPEKPKAKNKKGKSDLAKAAMFLEYIFSKGITLDEAKDEVKRAGADPDAMDIEGAFKKHQTEAIRLQRKSRQGPSHDNDSIAAPSTPAS